MKTWISWLGLVVTVAGCTPKSNDAGMLDTGSDGDGDGDGGSGDGSGDGSGSASGGSDGGSASASASASGTSGPTGGTTDATGGETTGGGVPAACVEQGWLDSYEAFMAMSAAAGDTYWYFSADGGDQGFFINCNYRTTIVVEAGQVIRREFENLGPPDTYPDLECTSESFVEEGDQVGTNDVDWARPPWTLEQLYQGCCEEVLTQPEDQNLLTFTTDRAGLIAACSYFPLNCADGCDAGPTGYGSISIDGISFGPWPPD